MVNAPESRAGIAPVFAAVQGKVSFNGNDRDVDRTTTVEIKEVGKTKLGLSEENQKKLS